MKIRRENWLKKPLLDMMCIVNLVIGYLGKILFKKENYPQTYFKT